MPLYDYRCDDCGDFRAFRPMKESDLPAKCPDCGTSAPRQVSAPYLSGGGGWLPRAAGGRNGRAGGNWRSACGMGCGHAGCA